MLQPRTLALIAAVLAASGASAVPRLKPLPEPVAQEGRALLVLVVDSRFGVGKLTLAREDGKPAYSLVVDAAAGDYSLRVYSVPLGKYRMIGLTLPSVRRKPFEVEGSEPFEVGAGRKNYVGDLDVYNDRGDLRYRIRDHSGRLVSHLRERASAFLGGDPVAFVGGESDGWARSLEGDAR
jgi:hypothetical protein